MPTAHRTTPAGWDTVTLTVNDRPLTLPAEPVAPGLALVPAVTDSGWSNGYTVVHTASGQHAGPYCLPLAYAREFAVALTAAGHDWTCDLTTVRTDPVVREHYFGTLFDLQAARDFGAPLWWARASWRRVPPPWVITGPDREAWAVRTWADVVAEADRAAAGHASFIPDDAVVTRGDRAEWELVCAAPFCGQEHGPAVLTYWADDHGDDVPMRSEDRADLTVEAHEQHWRPFDHRHGQRWLCPACADDHPRARN